MGARKSRSQSVSRQTARCDSEMSVNDRIALSGLRVSGSTCVSNLQERSLIREKNAENRAKNYECNAAREWHIACTEVYRRVSAEKSMRTLTHRDIAL